MNKTVVHYQAVDYFMMLVHQYSFRVVETSAMRSTEHRTDAGLSTSRIKHFKNGPSSLPSCRGGYTSEAPNRRATRGCFSIKWHRKLWHTSTRWARPLCSGSSSVRS